MDHRRIVIVEGIINQEERWRVIGSTASGRLLEVNRIARILGHGRRARMPVKDSEQETGYGQDWAHRD